MSGAPFKDLPGCKFVLRHDNGTYFVKWTAIGPMFGGTFEQAKRFDTREEAGRLLLDWRTGDSTIEVDPTTAAEYQRHVEQVES